VSGIPLLRLLKEMHPEIPLIIYTAIEQDQAAIDNLFAQGATQYLPKGTMGEMLTAVQSALVALPPQ
jgi:DNA-binding NarL/FixJ family response regulator